MVRKCNPARQKQNGGVLWHLVNSVLNLDFIPLRQWEHYLRQGKIYGAQNKMRYFLKLCKIFKMVALDDEIKHEVFSSAGPCVTAEAAYL